MQFSKFQFLPPPTQPKYQSLTKITPLLFRLGRVPIARSQPRIRTRVQYSSHFGHIFITNSVSRPALGPTQPPIHWVPGALSLGVKRPGREADHSPPSRSEVGQRMCGAISPLPQYVFMNWCLVKHSDNFSFTLQVSVLSAPPLALYSLLCYDLCA
jgi:hypothetical protein